MNRSTTIATAIAAAATLTACASMSDRQYDDLALKMINDSFRTQGIASVTRVKQDGVQEACSALTLPSAEAQKKLEAEQMATIKWPSDGRYLGDWKRGEALAQNGRGMTWTDKPDSAERRQLLQLPPDRQGRDLLRHAGPEPVQLRQAARRREPGIAAVRGDREVHLGQAVEREGLQRRAPACRASATPACSPRRRSAT